MKDSALPTSAKPTEELSTSQEETSRSTAIREINDQIAHIMTIVNARSRSTNRQAELNRSLREIIDNEAALRDRAISVLLGEEMNNIGDEDSVSGSEENVSIEEDFMIDDFGKTMKNLANEALKHRHAAFAALDKSLAHQRRYETIHRNQLDWLSIDEIISEQSRLVNDALQSQSSMDLLSSGRLDNFLQDNMEAEAAQSGPQHNRSYTNIRYRNFHERDGSLGVRRERLSEGDGYQVDHDFLEVEEASDEERDSSDDDTNTPRNAENI